MPARIPTGTCKAGDGDIWRNEELGLMQSRRAERFCLQDLSSRINTRLFTGIIWSERDISARLSESAGSGASDGIADAFCEGGCRPRIS